MIGQQLNPIPLRADLSFLEMLQSHSLTYLAGYQNATAAENVRQSFQRAWAMDQILSFNGSSSFWTGYTLNVVCALWESHQYRRLVVAIPGMTSLYQITRPGIFRLPGGDFLHSDNHPVAAKCLAVYKHQADNVISLIRQNPDVAAALDNPGFDITFTGASLGAAVAEVLACRYFRQNPDRSIRLCKFGSPKVGNHTWMVMASSGFRIARESVYVDRDPVWSIPINTLNTSILSLGAFDHILTSLHQWPTCTRMNLNGNLMEQWPFSNARTWMRQFTHSVSALTPANDMWGHLQTSVRMACMGNAAQHSYDAELRYNGLDYPDENWVQHQFQIGNYDWRNYEWMNNWELGAFVPRQQPPGDAANLGNEVVRRERPRWDGIIVGHDDPEPNNPFVMQPLTPISPNRQLPRRRQPPNRIN